MTPTVVSFATWITFTIQLAEEGVEGKLDHYNPTSNGRWEDLSLPLLQCSIETTGIQGDRTRRNKMNYFATFHITLFTNPLHRGEEGFDWWWPSRVRDTFQRTASGQCWNYVRVSRTYRTLCNAESGQPPQPSHPQRLDGKQPQTSTMTDQRRPTQMGLTQGTAYMTVHRIITCINRICRISTVFPVFARKRKSEKRNRTCDPPTKRGGSSAASSCLTYLRNFTDRI